MPHVQRGKIDPPWRRFTNAEEDQRLSDLLDRIERKKRNTEIMQKEVTRIMHRAIRRMRRAKGKT